MRTMGVVEFVILRENKSTLTVSTRHVHVTDLPEGFWCMVRPGGVSAGEDLYRMPDAVDNSTREPDIPTTVFSKSTVYEDMNQRFVDLMNSDLRKAEISGDKERWQYITENEDESELAKLEDLVTEMMDDIRTAPVRKCEEDGEMSARKRRRCNQRELGTIGDADTRWDNVKVMERIPGSVEETPVVRVIWHDK